MKREEAIERIKWHMKLHQLSEERSVKITEALQMAIEALSAEPTVIRCRTLLSDEDFKAVAERIREINQNVIVIPCETEVVSTETSTDLISRADAIELCAEAQGRASTKSELKGISKIWNGLKKIPPAKVPTKCIAEIKIDTDEVVQKVKEKYDLADRPSGEWSFIGDNLFECTCCGVAYTPDQLKATIIKKGQFAPNYCPNCGADMRGEKYVND